MGRLCKTVVLTWDRLRCPPWTEMSYSAEKQLWIFHLVATRTVVSINVRSTHFREHSEETLRWNTVRGTESLPVSQRNNKEIKNDYYRT